MVEGGKEGKVVWNGGWEGVIIGLFVVIVDWFKVKLFNVFLLKINGFFYCFMVFLFDYFKEDYFFYNLILLCFFCFLSVYVWYKFVVIVL